MKLETKQAIAATIGLVAAAWVSLLLFVTFPVWIGPLLVWLWWRGRRG